MKLILFLLLTTSAMGQNKIDTVGRTKMAKGYRVSVTAYVDTANGEFHVKDHVLYSTKVNEIDSTQAISPIAFFDTTPENDHLDFYPWFFLCIIIAFFIIAFFLPVPKWLIRLFIKKQNQ